MPARRSPGSPTLGPIIVTEPRVQAAVGVADLRRRRSCRARAASGRASRSATRSRATATTTRPASSSIVTDGTMINWLREGRLSRIGTVIVDEAHERSTNIDFIMGYLKQELAEYPHLRVIITSATFNTDFYLEYFGGPEVVSVMEVPAEKTFGYGMPLFADLDTAEDGEEDVLDAVGRDEIAAAVAPAARATRTRSSSTHWPRRSSAAAEGDR